MSMTRHLEPDFAAAMEGLVTDLLAVTQSLAQTYNLDPIDAAMCLGSAGNVMLYRTFDCDQKRRAAAQIYSQSAIHSMEDMISGRNMPSYARN